MSTFFSAEGKDWGVCAFLALFATAYLLECFVLPIVLIRHDMADLFLGYC